jgi:Nitronate monooxygenase
VLLDLIGRLARNSRELWIVQTLQMATEQSEEATMSPTRRELITAMAAAAITNPACALPNEHTQSQGKPPLLSPLSKALLQEFGLKYPIFEAPHGPQTSPELAIAVSNAGAMGALASLDTPEMARSAVAKVRPGTKGYFVVNFILQFEPALSAALDAGHRSSSSPGRSAFVFRTAGLRCTEPCEIALLSCGMPLDVPHQGRDRARAM